MSELGRADLKDALDLVGELADNTGPDPFALPVLTRLQHMTDADRAVGYVESPLHADGEHYELATRPKPTWLCSALRQIGQQDPIHAVHCHQASDPVAISDRISAREFHRLDVYRLVCEPLGTADSIRLYLPAPAGSARFFFFDRSRRGFPARTRTLLQVLRPHLTHARTRHHDALAAAIVSPLTPREAMVIHWVACGATNAQIARQLWVSEHTVRKHLENIYSKLGVHSRTEAVAVLSRRTN